VEARGGYKAVTRHVSAQHSHTHTPLRCAGPWPLPCQHACMSTQMQVHSVTGFTPHAPDVRCPLASMPFISIQRPKVMALLPRGTSGTLPGSILWGGGVRRGGGMGGGQGGGGRGVGGCIE
jgi:hypothetical protein